MIKKYAQYKIQNAYYKIWLFNKQNNIDLENIICSFQNIDKVSPRIYYVLYLGTYLYYKL